jgi:hypothetical protein
MLDHTLETWSYRNNGCGQYVRKISGLLAEYSHIYPS